MTASPPAHAASDPAGEALTYRSPSVFLPAGATFTEATRRFSWPSPGPVCGEHDVVFRALDGSGGVPAGWSRSPSAGAGAWRSGA